MDATYAPRKVVRYCEKIQLYYMNKMLPFTLFLCSVIMLHIRHAQKEDISEDIMVSLLTAIPME